MDVIMVGVFFFASIVALERLWLALVLRGRQNRRHLVQR